MPVENGVLVDFSQMKAYAYNSTSDTITMQPGVLWGDVYDGLQSHGVAPVGGRQSDVGVSGFLLGGGLSSLSPAWGYGCDTIRSLEVVLTSGELVTATVNNQYADLFRALKGGGSRFGIITNYEVQAVHVGVDKTWYGGSIIVANTSIPAIIQATDDFIHSNTDSKAVILVAISQLNALGVPTTLTMANLFYNGTEAEFNTTFAEYLTIPALTTTIGPLSYNDITKVLPAGNERTNANLFGASALYPRQGLFQAAYAHWMNFSLAFVNELATSTLAFTPVPQSQIDLAQEFPVGITNISADVKQGLELLFSQIPPSAGLPIYLNESNEWQNALTTYTWFQQLKRVYAKYDPTR
ncbi:hypothetical protein HWV62_39233 [Athelia sp. TMB]|nr:hypothetical protein HWV62_39233 [Athelia sp. TMB]